MAKRRKLPAWVGPVAIVTTGVALGTTLVLLSLHRRPYECPTSLPPEACQLAEQLSTAAAVANLDDNFVPFALATAHRESRYNPGAINTSSANNACELYWSSRDSYYADNPYPPERWCWGAGGLWGFMPATGLKSPAFRNEDPYLVFDPAASTAMFVDFVERIVHDHFDELPASQRNWLAIRRAMAGLSVMRDYTETKSRAREVRQRLAADLKAVGADPNLMYEQPKLGDYPGADVVWHELRGPLSLLA